MSLDFMKLYAEQLGLLLPKRRRHTVVQAGGYTGIVPKVLATYFERVVTFEPSKNNIQHLQETCQNTAVRFMESALGNKDGMAYLETPPGRADLGHLADKGLATERVQVVTLDRFSFMAVDLLALDVAGWEYEALEGATDTIYKHKPAIVVELGRAMCGRRKDVPQWLKDHGYVPFHFINTDYCFHHIDDTELKEYHDERCKKNPAPAA